MDLYSSALRARLFAQLATLERSGIPLLQALPLLRREVPKALHSPLEKLQQIVARGGSLADAGRRSGALLPREERLIRAAEDAGKLGGAFGHLRDYYEGSARRARKIKTKLVYPLTLLILALLLLPLPALIAGRISGGGYLLRALLPLALLYISTRLLLGAYRRLSNGRSGGVLSQLLLALPTLRQRLRYDALSGLALLLRAGVPAQDALDTAHRCAGEPTLRQQFYSARHALEHGAPLNEALAGAGLLDSTEGALLASAETAGRLDEGFEHYLRRQGDALDARQTLLAEWLPRLVYLLVVAAIAWRLVGSA